MKTVTMYHATSVDNMTKIMYDGIKPGCDGIVYLAETDNDAYKFVCLRMLEKIAVFKVNVNVEDVFETFDHSQQFFKCKAFGHKGTILPDNFETLTVYTNSLFDNVDDSENKEANHD